MSGGNTDYTVTSTPPGLWSVRKLRQWNGDDRQFKTYPKASLVSVNRAEKLFDDLDDEAKARTQLISKNTRREARRLKVKAGLASSGQGFFFHGKTSEDRPPRRAFTKDNNYSVWDLTQKDAIGGFARTDGSVYYGGKMAFAVPNWNTSVPISANEQLVLINRLRAKTQGSSFNAGVMLAESNEAVRLVADSAIRVAKSLHHLTRGDLAGSARAIFEGTSRAPIRPYREMKPFKPTVDRASSLWLEMRYGWTPLLGEASSAAQFLAHQLHAPARMKQKAFFEARTFRDELAAGPWLAPITARAVLHRQRWLTAVFEEDVPPGLSLDHIDPATILWERVPLSFVADWFLPIGDYLQARAAVNSIKCSYHVIATKYDNTAYGPVSSALVDDNYGESQYHSVRFTREVIQGPIQVPLPRFTPLSEALSIRRCIDAISLVSQAFLGGISKWSKPMG